jgi:hypothetical protein
MLDEYTRRPLNVRAVSVRTLIANDRDNPNANPDWARQAIDDGIVTIEGDGIYFRPILGAKIAVSQTDWLVKINNDLVSLVDHQTFVASYDKGHHEWKQPDTLAVTLAQWPKIPFAEGTKAKAWPI